MNLPKKYPISSNSPLTVSDTNLSIEYLRLERSKKAAQKRGRRFRRRRIVT